MSRKSKIIGLLVSMALLGVIMHFLSVENMLHMRLYYSGLDAQAYLAGLTPKMKLLSQLHGVVDLFFIACYSTLFSILLKSKWAMVPGLIDFAETFGTIMAMGGFENAITPWLGCATLLKWVSIAVVLGFYLRQRLTKQS